MLEINLMKKSHFRLSFFSFAKVRRLSEGFFRREKSRMKFLMVEGDSCNDLHDLVRNSSYYCRLAPLIIECVELDGIPDTLPILIEEIYSTFEEKPIESSIQTKSKSNGANENPIVQAVQSFSKNFLKGIRDEFQRNND